jgi:hypothetical protein
MLSLTHATSLRTGRVENGGLGPTLLPPYGTGVRECFQSIARGAMPSQAPVNGGHWDPQLVASPSLRLAVAEYDCCRCMALPGKILA